MRVLIYGGRDFVGRDHHLDLLDYVLADWDSGEITVISGCAKGADEFGERWAESWGHPVDRFPADWEQHGKAAGMIRNQQMLDSGVDYAVQFPGGKGTADMRRRLDKAGVKVWDVSNG